MNANTNDTRNFILPLPPPPPPAGSSGASDATATFQQRHMVGGVLKPQCYPKKVRRKSSKVKHMDMDPLGGGTTSSKQPKYPKKPPLTPPDPDAPKIARPCSECGKKFWSWKALFGHMRCHPERQWRGINPPPNFRRPSPSPSPSHCGYDQSSFSTWPPHHDDNDDECGLKPQQEAIGVGFGISCCSNSDGGGRGTIREEDDDEMMINIHNHHHHQRHTCSICSRVFSSGRALGGHKRFHCSSRDRGGGGGGNNHNILCSSSSTNNYLDFNLNLVPTTTPAPAPQDRSSSASPLPTLDLSLGL
ncbi:PREDICTED: zinc finger protein ZAT3-like [Ipomoea nil]|uniref:zinc finger protein ZAT3-like n=1 Tax=Ipomoea nil TaxID=35883 RepID=UPI000900EEF3|nr:PREDICTED: zinc finger protein ZAT3-like [Ipomoea nil]